MSSVPGTVSARVAPPPRWPSARRGHEGGSAVVDFVLVGSLVLLLGLGLLQLGLALHVRNTLTWCAAEGARVGARAGSTPEEGAERARRLIAESLSPAYAGQVSAGRRVEEGVLVVVVEVRAPLPVVALWGPPETVTARARAFAEDQDGGVAR